MASSSQESLLHNIYSELSPDKSEWVLADVADKSNLGSRERVEKKRLLAPESAFSIANTEPEPRGHHLQSFIGNKMYVWGGFTKDTPANHSQMFSSFIHCFDTDQESWSVFPLKLPLQLSLPVLTPRLGDTCTRMVG